jgi:hypothetical protein
MDFTIENFDFKVNTLNSKEEIDKILDDNALQIKGFTAKLTNREFQQDKTENRSENLDEDIVELQALISSKQTEMNSYPEGSRKKQEIAIDLEMYRARLNKLNFRKTDTVSPLSLFEKNIDTGEAQLLLAYYTSIKQALEQRKAQL